MRKPATPSQEPSPTRLLMAKGLFLLIMPSGSKYWRLKYFFAGKEKLLALGVYPEITLADARERRAQARKVLAAGNDPGEVKKEAKRVVTSRAPTHLRSLPASGLKSASTNGRQIPPKPCSTVSKQHILPEARPKANCRHHRAGSSCHASRRRRQRGFGTGPASDADDAGRSSCMPSPPGRAERNPVPDLRGALKTPVVKHHSFLKASDLPAIPQETGTYDGSLQTKLALRFLLLTFVRTRELRRRNGRRLIGTKPNGEFLPNA